MLLYFTFLFFFSQNIFSYFWGFIYLWDKDRRLFSQRGGVSVGSARISCGKFDGASFAALGLSPAPRCRYIRADYCFGVLWYFHEHDDGSYLNLFHYFLSNFRRDFLLCGGLSSQVFGYALSSCYYVYWVYFLISFGVLSPSLFWFTVVALLSIVILVVNVGKIYNKQIYNISQLYNKYNLVVDH